MLFFKTLCACCDSGHREPSPNMRQHRTAREEGRTLSGHKECLWSTKGRLFPLHLVSMRETLLPKAQPRWVHLHYHVQIGTLCTPHRPWYNMAIYPLSHLTWSLMWRQTSHNTQNDHPQSTGHVLRLRRERPGSCSVDGGWGLTGLERPSYHFAGLPLWAWGTCWVRG